MPELLYIKSRHWELTVWSKSIEQQLAKLTRTLSYRNKDLPAAHLLFHPAVTLGHVTVISGADDVPFDEKSCSSLDLPTPLFFENTLYEFEFTFQNDADYKAVDIPEISHKLNSVNRAFHYSDRHGVRSLRGSVSTGNDIGWFRLPFEFTVSGIRHQQSLSFEVLPVKIDLAGDMRSIYSVIDGRYPLWRFALAEKTEQSADSNEVSDQRLPLLWISQFESLREQLSSGMKLVLNSPHSRLLPHSRNIKPDKIKGKVNEKLSIRMREDQQSGVIDKRYRVNTKHLSTDTPENRFIKMVLVASCRNLELFKQTVKAFDSAPEKQRLSDRFYARLDFWKASLEKYRRHPMFSDVGEYTGMNRESLVLHQKPGYSKVYRTWHQLKKLLDVMGTQSSVSMKSVAEVYEVWCFLEIHQILLRLGFEEKQISGASMNKIGGELRVKDGFYGAFQLERSDGVRIRLVHEPVFRKKTLPIRSYSTVQKPDILLEAHFADGSNVVWIFDAKYRISNDSVMDSDDLVPDDALNQMHRYRDALIYLLKDKYETKTRPVLGAYALYPGFMNQGIHNSDQNPYYESISEIGIGAFPLLPTADYQKGMHSGNTWLSMFLKEKLENKADTESFNTDRYFVEESVRIPYRGMTVSRYTDLSLVVTAAPRHGRSQSYNEGFSDGAARWYHMKLEATDRKNIVQYIVREIRFLSVAVYDAAAEKRVARLVWPVRNVEIKPRDHLTEIQTGSVSNSQELYWIFQLDAPFMLDEDIVGFSIRQHQVKLTELKELHSKDTFSSLNDAYHGLIYRERNV